MTNTNPSSRASGPRRSRMALAALAAVAAAALAGAGGAVAAVTAPEATTGPATQVTYGSAVLTGTANPHGAETLYYFQYGLTKLYGNQTAIASAGSGKAPAAVQLPVAGLSPLTQYHYRLVAVNPAGATIGADRTFLTTAIPLSLQILAAPSPVVFGSPVTIQGTLSGTANGNREVVLQGVPFGSTAGFQPVGNPELTSATGGFSFTLASLASNTQFRVVAAANPAVVSPVTEAQVAVKVVSHIGRSRRAGRIRVFGTVTPAEPGMHVSIVRTVHGRSVSAGTTALRALSATSSSFSVVVPHRRGVYRVFAKIVGRGQVSAYGPPMLVR